jgi:hypothetical protein
MRKLQAFLIPTLVALVSIGGAAQPAPAIGIASRVAVKSNSTEAPRISGDEVLGGSLATSNGSWGWTPSFYSYQWLLCNTQGRRCQPLSGLTTKSITVPAAAVGLRLRTKVTATGSSKTASATSDPSGLIAPAPVAEEPAPAPEEPAPQPEEPAPGGGEPSPPPPPPAGGELFREEFSSPDGLITNEYATWNPDSTAATISPTWEMTSGSLFAQSATGWTGVPDGCSTSSATSSPCTASDVFRLNTIRHDFGNVTVSLDLRNNYLTSSSRTPAQNWDGVHVWLHYQSEYNLYYASFNRRDGRIVIKKKCVGGSENGGTYYELGSGEVSGYPIPFGTWQHLAAAIRDNSDGSVTITMWRAGVKLLSATDSGLGCAPITDAGSVGVRGDNDDFNLDNFIVTQG